MTLEAALHANSLTLEIVGGVILALAAVNKSDERIRDESGTYFGWNRHLRNTLVESRLEGLVGLAYVIVGSLFDLAMVLWSLGQVQVAGLYKLTPLLTIAVAVAVRCAIRRTVLPESIARVSAPIYQQHGIPPEPMAAARIAGDMNVKRQAAETDEQYRARVWSKIQRLTAKTTHDKPVKD